MFFSKTSENWEYRYMYATLANINRKKNRHVLETYNVIVGSHDAGFD